MDNIHLGKKESRISLPSTVVSPSSTQVLWRFNLLVTLFDGPLGSKENSHIQSSGIVEALQTCDDEHEPIIASA